MTASNEFIEYVMELLEPIAVMDGGKFFGGFGIKSNSIQFAMIMDNSLYFVVNDETRPKYEKLKKKPFSYQTKKGTVNVKRYYEVPEDLFDEPDDLIKWAKESIDIAHKTQRKK